MFVSGSSGDRGKFFSNVSDVSEQLAVSTCSTVAFEKLPFAGALASVNVSPGLYYLLTDVAV